MVIKPDQPADNSVEEGASDVQETTSPDATVAKPTKRTPKPKARAETKPRAKAKAATPRKKPTAKKQRPDKTARPVEPAPPVYTLEELKEQGSQAKTELVSAVIEPAVEALGSLSQTVRDTIGGALSGLLSRKRRDD